MSRNWSEGAKILLVEDDLLTARLIRARLEMDGLMVLETRNGQEGLAMLQSEGADIVTTDLMMPAMDGFRLINEIRSLPDPLGKVPILVLSVNQGEDDMVRCLASGADDYMTKPFSPQVYIEKLWRLYSRRYVS
jgi:DNA-binding response OmpR family regulator